MNLVGLMTLLAIATLNGCANPGATTASTNTPAVPYPVNPSDGLKSYIGSTCSGKAISPTAVFSNIDTYILAKNGTLYVEHLHARVGFPLAGGDKLREVVTTGDPSWPYLFVS